MGNSISQEQLIAKERLRQEIRDEISKRWRSVSAFSKDERIREELGLGNLTTKTVEVYLSGRGERYARSEKVLMRIHEYFFGRKLAKVVKDGRVMGYLEWSEEKE